MSSAKPVSKYVLLFYFSAELNTQSMKDHTSCIFHNAHNVTYYKYDVYWKVCDVKTIKGAWNW